MGKKGARGAKKTAKNGGAKANTGNGSVTKKLSCDACGIDTVRTLDEMVRHKQWCPAVRAKKDAASKAKAALSSQKRKNR